MKSCSWLTSLRTVLTCPRWLFPNCDTVQISKKNNCSLRRINRLDWATSVAHKHQAPFTYVPHNSCGMLMRYLPKGYNRYLMVAEMQDLPLERGGRIFVHSLGIRASVRPAGAGTSSSCWTPGGKLHHNQAGLSPVFDIAVRLIFDPSVICLICRLDGIRKRLLYFKPLVPASTLSWNDSSTETVVYCSSLFGMMSWNSGKPINASAHDYSSPSLRFVG